jgi:hypothetical protein
MMSGRSKPWLTASLKREVDVQRAMAARCRERYPFDSEHYYAAEQLASAHESAAQVFESRIETPDLVGVVISLPDFGGDRSVAKLNDIGHP